VLACFLMGFLFQETLERLTISPILRLGILTGFIGGFSTFSTFAMETLLLAEQGDPSKGLLYVVVSVVLGLAAVTGGAYLARYL
jgi:CrcB protein